jgi:long-chain acyl-CoA synthetase
VDKIWLQSYQEGVPAEIELSEFQSLGEMFEKSVSLYRERIAYINMGVEITYGELDKQ